MRRLIIGTAGHIDHGKTSLVRALTGVDTDRLPEEKRRGITIDLGFAAMSLGEVKAGIVDVPGHEALVRNMLAGATGIDIVLLVIAADEGIMPQTREHLAIMDLLQVGAAVVALTKSDLVEPEWLELVTNDVCDVMRATRFGSAAVIPVSAVTGSGLTELRTALTEAAHAVTTRSRSDLFRMPVDRVFTVHGTGTVVTGTVWSGEVCRDASLWIMPSAEPARARGLQLHGASHEYAIAGERLALALAIDRDDVGRGDVLVSTPAWAPTALVTARVRVLADADKPLKHRQRIRFHLGTAEVLGRVATLEAPEIEPGTEAWVQLRLEAPVIARAGDRFVLRSYSPVHTIAGGTIAEPVPSRRKRITAEAAARLALLAGRTDADMNAGAALDALLAEEGTVGVPRHALALRLPLDLAATDDALDAALRDGRAVLVTDRIFPMERADAAITVVAGTVANWHLAHPLSAGLPKPEMRAVRSEFGEVLSEWAVQTLIKRGQLRFEDGALAAATFSRSTDPAQTAAAERVMEILQAAGLEAPVISDLPPDLAGRKDILTIMRFLETGGRVVALTRDRFAETSAVRALAAKLSSRFSPGADLSTAELKDAIAVSRKYLIPLLEYFDREGISRRNGDMRQWVGLHD
jgi:selenocysteine-specific elongation factor